MQHSVGVSVFSFDLDGEGKMIDVPQPGSGWPGEGRPDQILRPGGVGILRPGLQGQRFQSMEGVQQVDDSGDRKFQMSGLLGPRSGI